MNISLQSLSVAYGARVVLHPIDLCAQPGRVLGIVGPNGSGKSTLVKAVAGQVKASGQLLFSGSGQLPLVTCRRTS